MGGLRTRSKVQEVPQKIAFFGGGPAMKKIFEKSEKTPEQNPKVFFSIFFRFFEMRKNVS